MHHVANVEEALAVAATIVADERTAGHARNALQSEAGYEIIIHVKKGASPGYVLDVCAYVRRPKFQIAHFGGLE